MLRAVLEDGFHASSAVAGDELFLRGAGPSPAGDGTHEQANRPDSWAETAGLS